MGRTNTHLSRLPFVVDPHTLVRNSGRQIDWSKLGDAYRPDTETYEVEVSANAAVAATSVSVIALPVRIPAGAVLDFGGVRTAHTITVTAAADADAVTIAVQALPCALPDNAILDFGGDKFARLNGAAAAGATSLTVDALTTALAGNETATYVTISKKVELSADAAVGATSLSVVALDAAVLDGDKAAFTVVGSQPKRIPAGSIMHQLSSGLLVPRGLVSGGSDKAVCILETEAVYNDDEAVGHNAYGCLIGGVIYSNLLPDAAATDFATWLTELRTYGTGFVFETYADSRIPS